MGFFSSSLSTLCLAFEEQLAPYIQKPSSPSYAVSIQIASQVPWHQV